MKRGLRFSSTAGFLLTLLSLETGHAQGAPGAQLIRLELSEQDGRSHEVTGTTGASIHFEDPDTGAVRSVPYFPGLRAPAGVWSWHVEGPGWIGFGQTPDLVSGSGPVSLSARAAPSCRTEILRSMGPQRFTRLEVYSESWSTWYPVDPRQRQAFEVPEGRFGLVFRDSSNVVGISAPLECDGKSVLSLDLPSLPGQGLESTLLRLELPPGSQSASRVEAVLRGVGTASMRDVTEDVLRVRSRGSEVRFFVNRASRPTEILVEGSDVKSLRELLVEQDRAVREVVLRVFPRASLTLDVDYRPIRPHGRETLSLWRCHDGPLDPYALGQRVARGECDEIATNPLRTGRGPHRFDRLDQGIYVFAARIDEEMLTSEEFEIAPVLGVADTELEAPESWILREMEIFGQLLDSGEPVPGVVRVSGHLENHSQYQVFPTDEDLVYHWTYFGRPFRQRGDFPWKEEREAGDRGALLAAEPWARVQACVREGSCFVAASEAYFVGEGRFDIVLPATAPIALTVLDAETQAPIPEAKVLITGRRFNLAFRDGVVRILDAPGFRDELVTDSDGKATFRLPDEPDLGVLVARRGYEPQQLDLSKARSAEQGESIVHLRPKPDPTGGTTIRNAQGAPVAGADIVVVAAEEDHLRVQCSERTNDQGVVELGGGCRLDEALGVLIVHRSVGTILVSPQDLIDQPELRLVDVPEPLVVQFRYPDGSPAGRHGLWLGIEGRPLPPELYWLLRSEGRIPDLVSDDRGELRLLYLLGEDDWFLSVGETDGRGFGPMQRLYGRGSRRSLQTVLIDN